MSTATDYARFLQMTLNGGELDETRLLSRKTIELMTANHLTDQSFRAGQGFGLGFSVVEDSVPVAFLGRRANMAGGAPIT